MLVGVEGGQTYDNSFIGPSLRIEVPFAKHYEFQLQDSFEPLEAHTALGEGHANQARFTGIAWFTPTWGFEAATEFSNYSVTEVSKGAYYALGGPVARLSLYGYPVRLHLGVIRQIGNGVTPEGIESSHVYGGEMSLDARVGCAAWGCVRIGEELSIGHILTQGNPVCDGSRPGPVTCPRGSGVGGGMTASIRLEFPKVKNYDLF